MHLNVMSCEDYDDWNDDDGVDDSEKTENFNLNTFSFLSCDLVSSECLPVD